MDAQDAEKRYRWAESLYLEGEYAEALVTLDQLLAVFPGDRRVRLARARCFAGLKRYDDALRVCDDLVREQDYGRARDLAAQIRAARARPPAPAHPPPQSPPAQSPPAHESNAPRPVSRRVWLRGAGLAAAGVAAAGGATWWTRYREWRLENEADAAWEAERAAMEADRAAKDAARADAIARARQLPGYEHPTADWMATAENGIPLWEPGIFREVPTLSRPDFTMDVYLPLAYRSQPDTLFPCMTICWPHPDPGFVGMEAWAERNKVIIVAMNDVQNGTFARNESVQDAVLETIGATLRVDHRMGIAFGMSGGANTSWKMLQKYPENFAGVLMMGFAACGYGDLAPHIRVAYLYGNNDFNAKHIRGCIARLTRRNLPVQAIEFDGGHDVGPLNLRERMCDWLLAGAFARA